MKVKTIKYERLVNLGNFAHEKYGIEIELDTNDKAENAIQEAKRFVERQINPITEHEREIADKVNLYDKNDLPF